jgi:predicted permease
MDRFFQDLRYALRRLGRAPAFTAVAVLSLAVGIGANTAMFTLVNSVMLQEIPARAPEELVEIYTNDDDFLYATFSYPDFVDLREETGAVLEDVAATNMFFGRVREGEADAMIMGELVSGNYFDLLGVDMAMGRSFLLEEDQTPGTHPVTILSYGFWERFLGSDPEVLGREIQLNGTRFTVVGVAQPDFKGSFPAIVPDAWVPMHMMAEVMEGGIARMEQRGSRNLFLKGRLADGVTAEEAQAAVAVVASRLAEAYPDTNEDRVFTLVPSKDVAVHPFIDRALVPVAGLLMAVVGIVLLVACANLASFLLARATDRRKEVAVRLALGASRGQLVRQLLTETVLLAMAGGAAGLILAGWLLSALQTFQPPVPIPMALDLGLDRTVLLFTMGVAVAAGVVFGLIPALQAVSPDVAPTLRDESSGGGGSRKAVWIRNGLVVAQVTLSLVLLVGSSLFLRSMRAAQDVDPGFSTDPAAIVWINGAMSGYEEPQQARELLAELEARALALPGVTSVGSADRLPLGIGLQTRGYGIPGVEPPAGRENHEIDFTQINGSYFEAMGIELVQGRTFNESDGPDAPRVAIISEAAARQWWPGENPLGKVIHRGTLEGDPIQVIGVARDTKVRTIGEAPRPYVYQHWLQSGSNFQIFVVRGTTDESQLVRQVRREFLAVEPDLVIMEAKTMEDHMAIMLFGPRMAALLLSLFGGIALALACVGLYGVVSYAVSARTREVGIRMSLGASGKDVVGLILSGGMRLVIVGAFLGLGLSLALARLVSGFLYGVGAADLSTLIGVPAMFMAVSALAAFVPARRASRVDPMVALRSD